MNLNSIPQSLREHFTAAEFYPIEPRSGVYILFQEKEILYVGQTRKELVHRLSHHLKSKPFRATHYCFIPCEESGLDSLEFLLMTELKPVWNKLLPSNSEFVSPSLVSASLRKRGIYISAPKIHKRMIAEKARFKTLPNSILGWFHKEDIKRVLGV